MALDVLVIHYHEATGIMLCGMIKDLKHNGIYTSSIGEAAKRLEKEKYDMVIMTSRLDYDLADTKVVRQINKNTPLYYFEIYEPIHKDKLKEVGVTGFINNSSKLHDDLQRILQSTPKKA